MDFSNPAAMLSSILIGLIGMGMFMYGKKQGHVPSLIGGAVLSLETFFVHSTLVMWLVAAACIGGLYIMSQRSGSAY